jgi:hypothetical protein
MTSQGSALSSHLSLRLLASVLLTILYGIFLWDSYWGLGFTIVNIALLGTMSIVRPEVTKGQSLLFLITSALLSAFIPFRSFELGHYLTIFFVFLLNCLVVAKANSKNSEPFSLKGLIIIPINIGFNTFTEILRWPLRIKNLFTKNSPNEDGIKQNHLITGILIAIPLLFLFTILLTSADPVFERYLNDFFSKFSLDFSTLKKIVEIVFFFGLFSSLLNNNYTTSSEFSFLSETNKMQKEIGVASVFVVALLGAFLVVQGEFLFAGEKLLRDLNITLSQYTRNGYGQLLVVSSISLFLIFILTSGKEKSKSVLIKTVTAIFILEIFLLLFSATYRVYLYQHNFGLTEARILGMLFSLWIVGALGLSLYRFLSRSNMNFFFFGLFINAVLVIFLMHIINIDHTVDSYKKPNLGAEVDYPYIAKLSSDAWPVWDEALAYFENSPTCSWQEASAISSLKFDQDLYNNRSKNFWHNGGAWSSSDSQALDFLNKNIDRINKLQDKFEPCVTTPRNTEVTPSNPPSQLTIPDSTSSSKFAN